MILSTTIFECPPLPLTLITISVIFINSSYTNCTDKSKNKESKIFTSLPLGIFLCLACIGKLTSIVSSLALPRLINNFVSCQANQLFSRNKLLCSETRIIGAGNIGVPVFGAFTNVKCSYKTLKKHKIIKMLSLFLIKIHTSRRMKLTC